MKFRLADGRDAHRLYRLMERDFPENERQPYHPIRHQLKRGRQAAFVLEEGRAILAYALCAPNAAGGEVLLSYLATAPQCRGRGLGQALLRRVMTGYQAAGRTAMLAEVERPEDCDPEELRLRLRRIRFYERLGFVRRPDTPAVLYDVPMLLMEARLADGPPIDLVRAMREIYLPLVGKPAIHRICVGIAD